MKRPADQAKLLFLYLLRSSAEALATQNPAAGSSKIASSATTSTSTVTPQLLDGHISLRLARRADVPSIQRCNLATLPENYNANFYVNHMRLFPELALVAEHVPPQSSSSSSSSPSKKLFGNYDPNTAQSNNPQIIGYVLGKVDQKPIQYPPRQFLYPPSTAASLDDDDNNDESSLLEHMIESQNIPRTETLGHVTSLAVLSDYRRRGLAATLMKQLHKHMRDVYHADAVGLHVRVSNRAATRLYCDGMGYEVADVISGYYQDGEDAYFMKKVFDVEEEDDGDSGKVMDGGDDTEPSFEEFDSMGAASSTAGRLGVGGKVRRGLSNLRLGLKRGESSALNAMTKNRSRVWESGPVQFRLPRTVVDFSNDGDTASSSSSSEQEENGGVYEEDQPQILTGNM